ncbi:MAG: YgfZ/GcvT domain-containing protein [Longimicrobiales bacterium]
MLADFLAARGATFAEVDGLSVPRHYGSPAEEYASATTGCGVVLRGDRSLLRVHGRAPRQMLQGILTNSVSDPPADASGGHSSGESRYAAILTPKGRMVADLKQYWFGSTEEEGMALDVPAVAVPDVLEYFGRFLPPRFAKVVDLSGELCVITVLGPDAKLCIEASMELSADVVPAEGFALMGGGPLGTGQLMARGVEQVDSWDLIVPRERVSDVWEALEGAGAVSVGWGVWETLRVESGFLRFGSELTEKTIPLEAGIGERAFDHDKGCYTGQEVIVRIRHRGHVNWHLRMLLFGDSTPRSGDELFLAGGEKVIGRVTSSVMSPRFGQPVGLGYVRREVEPPAEVCLGSGEGAAVTVDRLPTESEPSVEADPLEL